MQVYTNVADTPASWLQKHHLAVLIIVVAIKQIILINVIPVWQVFDEPAHFQYTQTMVEDRKLPVFQPNVMHFSREVWASYMTVSDQLKQRFDIYPTIPDYPYKFGPTERNSVATGETPTNLAALYSPVYYLLEGLPYVATYDQSLEVRLTAMRLFSSVWLLITVWLAYSLIRKLRNSPVFALSVATMVGFFPMLGYVAAGVNNDIFLVMLVTASLERSVSWWHRRPTRGQLITAGLIAGLAAMTKQSGLLAVITVAIIYFITHRGHLSYAWVKRFCWFAIPAAIVGLSWTARALLTGNNFITSEGQTRFVSNIDLTPAQILYFDVFRRTGDIWLSGWGQFGWNQFFISFPSGVYVAAGLVSAIAVVGLWQLFRRRSTPMAWRQWLAANIFSLIILEIMYQALFWQRAISQNIIRFPNQGRYYFLLIVPLLTLLLAGIETLVGPKHRPLIWAGLTGLMVILSIWSIVIFRTGFSGIG